MIKIPLQNIGILAVTCMGVSALAQAPSSTNAVSSAQQAPAINFQILSQTKVQEADGSSTTFNFVAPPVLPAATPAPVPQPPSTAFLARANKTLKFLMLSATVYDHRITDLQCSDGTVSVRVFSNIDFSYFTGLYEIETADTIYDYMLFCSPASSQSLTQNATASSAMAQGNLATLGWLTQAEQQLPNLSLAPGCSSGYIVATSSAGDTSGLLASLNDLHAYYDANHAQLIAAFQQRATAEAAAEAYAASHPPGPPPPVVINFWPIKNSRYLTTGTGGNNQ